MIIVREDFIDIKQASEFATSLLGKNVTTSNISYLIQYGIEAKEVA